MSFKITTTTTAYTLVELREAFPEGYARALSHLTDTATEDFWAFDYPDLLGGFRQKHGQPDLDAEIDLYSARATGYLQVPAEMTHRWAEDGSSEVERVPVGRFFSMTGWSHLIGGEMYCWIPEEDGETLLAILDGLMEELVLRVSDGIGVRTAEQNLSEIAIQDGLLFDSDGELVGTISDTDS
jgi:hypothetical protein